ncbi:hypothetical protein [Tenuibacillus multivorans]|uniref:Uncharacterized protein n=1 Tax=Tenuibacillus multivorans TaxID=237069 RepID=A0A1G9XSJ8_9BACI|nr:hypothetical protein [Tenuibacillus multivorans]GEL75779.1 hypothetical protein TMU01_00140 [Tenuibacillus multivorans]SDM99145.1 hypothetical protein SAMN05216498_1072 [Tenuibacillus multivorans]
MNKLDVEQFKQLLQIDEMDYQEQTNQYLTDIYNMLKADNYSEIEKAEITSAIRNHLKGVQIINQNAIDVIETLLEETEGEIH